MLLCDICKKGSHTDCLDEPLKEVPQTKWICEDYKVNFQHKGHCVCTDVTGKLR